MIGVYHIYIIIETTNYAPSFDALQGNPPSLLILTWKSPWFANKTETTIGGMCIKTYQNWKSPFCGFVWNKDVSSNIAPILYWNGLLHTGTPVYQRVDPKNKCFWSAQWCSMGSMETSVWLLVPFRKKSVAAVLFAKLGTIQSFPPKREPTAGW